MLFEFYIKFVNRWQMNIYQIDRNNIGEIGYQFYQNRSIDRKRIETIAWNIRRYLSFQKKSLKNLENFWMRPNCSFSQQYNERYLHWEELKYRKFRVDPAVIWNIMKISRILKSKSLKFGGLDFQIHFNRWISGKTPYFRQIRSRKPLSSLETLQDNNKKYIISSLMEEAIAQAWLKEQQRQEVAKRMLQENRKPTAKRKMIVNNYINKKHILDLKNEPFTPDKNSWIHMLITNGTLKILNTKAILE